MQCCAVYKRQSFEILFFKECLPLEVDEQKKNLNDILLYVNDFKYLKEKDIQKINTQSGIWYLSLDQRNCCHLVYCQQNYPEKSALRFLSQMKRLVADVNQYDTNPKNIEKFISHKIYNLIKGYNANPNYDDDYQDSEKSIVQITVQIQDNNNSFQSRTAADPKTIKSKFIEDSPNKKILPQSNSIFYPKPTTSIQFNEYVCYGFMLLIAFLMMILIMIKVA